MHHVAIMKKSWGLTHKILTGKKKIESRWYESKRSPWNRAAPSDTVYFKNSGEPVTLKAEVSKILQFESLNPNKVRQLLEKYGTDDGIEKKDLQTFYTLFKNKKYCILVFLKNPKKIKPFSINKTGFGAMSAWLTTKNISSIKTK